jgi:hypothetical protein
LTASENGFTDASILRQLPPKIVYFRRPVNIFSEAGTLYGPSPNIVAQTAHISARYHAHYIYEQLGFGFHLSRLPPSPSHSDAATSLGLSLVLSLSAQMRRLPPLSLPPSTLSGRRWSRPLGRGPVVSTAHPGERPHAPANKDRALRWLRPISSNATLATTDPAWIRRWGPAPGAGYANLAMGAGTGCWRRRSGVGGWRGVLAARIQRWSCGSI